MIAERKSGQSLALGACGGVRIGNLEPSRFLRGLQYVIVLRGGQLYKP